MGTEDLERVRVASVDVETKVKAEQHEDVFIRIGDARRSVKFLWRSTPLGHQHWRI